MSDNLTQDAWTETDVAVQAVGSGDAVESTVEAQDEGVRLAFADGIATLTLDRPGSLNALSQPMMQSLERRLRVVAGLPGLRAVMLTGVFHLHEQEARQVMTPIPAVVTVDLSEDVETALRRCISSGHTRLLVTEDENHFGHVRNLLSWDL